MQPSQRHLSLSPSPTQIGSNLHKMQSSPEETQRAVRFTVEAEGCGEVPQTRRIRPSATDSLDPYSLVTEGRTTSLQVLTRYPFRGSSHTVEIPSWSSTWQTMLWNPSRPPITLPLPSTNVLGGVDVSRDSADGERHPSRLDRQRGPSGFEPRTPSS